MAKKNPRPKVVTDNKWKPFKYRDEVPKKVLKREFDWTDETNGYFKYRGTWYHLSMFMRGGVPGWDGSHADSAFRGVLLQLSPDGEEYRVGTYLA